MAYALLFNKQDTLAATLNSGATSTTLQTGNFASPSGTQLYVVDYDVPAKAEIISATVAGTAVTSVTRGLTGGAAGTTDHAIGAKIGSIFVPQHYDRVATRTLGYSSATSNQGTFTSDTNLTSLSTTVTVPTGGTRIKVTGFVALQTSVSGDGVTVSLKENTTVLSQASQIISSSGFAHTMRVEYSVVATAGSHTYTISASRASGTGNITSVAAADRIAFILVENIE